jgi:hypothetical protein
MTKNSPFFKINWSLTFETLNLFKLKSTVYFEYCIYVQSSAIYY